MRGKCYIEEAGQIIEIGGTNNSFSQLLIDWENDFFWNKENKTWCLVSNTSETDDYNADSLEEAILDAENYLLEYNAEYEEFEDYEEELND